MADVTTTGRYFLVETEFIFAIIEPLLHRGWQVAIYLGTIQQKYGFLRINLILNFPLAMRQFLQSCPVVS